MYAASVLEKQFSWTHSAWDPMEPVATRPLFITDNPFRFPSPGGLGRIFSSEYHYEALGESKSVQMIKVPPGSYLGVM